MSQDISDSFHCLFQMIEDCIYIHDVEGRFIAVNKAVSKTYGYPESFFIGKTPEFFGVPGQNDMKKIKGHWQKCLEGESQRFEFWAKTADGTVFPKELVISVGNYQGQKVIIAVAREIKERKALEDKLRHLAENDSLTQLYNRRVFFELAEKALSFSQRYCQSLSLILIDIDHFKQINDRLGHPGGDTVLRAFGKFCKENARASDIVARIGGEEFAIVMPNTSLEQSMQWAGLFNDNLSDLVVAHDDEKISFSVSMGIATLTEEVSTITDLVRMADTALYQAKDAGRDCIKVA